MAAPKIVVLGSLNGQLKTAFQKLATLHAKNGFALAILTGDIFGSSPDEATVQQLIHGSIEIPLPTYFTIGQHALPSEIEAKIEAEEEICPNLHYLGKRSTIKTSDGIRIVTLGGLLDSNLVGGQSKEQHLPFHTSDDAKALRGAHNADILLTDMWPAGIWKGSHVTLEASNQATIKASEDIAGLCAALRPRYHFSASPGSFFYEREVFLQPGQKETDLPSATRFISMAPYGNEAKAKAMYAFALNKTDPAIPAGATLSPFAPREKKRARDGEGYSRYSQRDGHRGHHNKKRRHSPPPGPGSCYFCLSNPNISTHMCCSIGEDSYVTTAKGPLSTSATFADQGLDFPSHFIVIPLPHAPTIQSMGSGANVEGEAVKTYKEMIRFKEALQATIASKSSHKLGVVTWEISRDRNIHLIWQLMPLPISMIHEGVAEAAFRVEAENDSYPVFTSQELPLEGQEDFGDFFRVWLWADDGEDKITGTSLVMPLPSNLRFDLQFGRRVVAKLMGLEHRIVWQDCAQTEEEETRDVEKFREAFKAWDFTLEA